VSPPIQWSPEPSVLAGVGLLTLLYLLGWRRARRPGAPHPPGYGRLALYLSGMAAVLVALVSPVDSISDDLMAIHMVQHILLLDIAPILMILGLTKGILRPLTRRVHELERRAGPLAHPAFAVVAYVGLMWAWHVPAMYDLALRHYAIHVGEHVCFALAGGLYWWHLLSPIRNRRRLGGLAPVTYMVVTKAGVGLLGILLAFDPTPLYAFYVHRPRYWGLSAREDQNLAGVIMALEQSVVMGIALVWLFVRMLGESDAAERRAERFQLVP